MKYFVIVALTAFTAVLAPASAQNAKPYVGGGFGATFIGVSGGALTLQVGAEDLLGPLGVRGILVVGLSAPFFEGAAELLASFPSGHLKLYVGGGVGSAIGGPTNLNVHGVGGLEYAATDSVGLFGEVQPRFYVTQASAFSLGVRFGANYHFD